MQRTFIFLAVILLLGCSIKYQLTLKGYYRPVDNNVFTYRKENFHLNSSIIDTSKIYCNAYPIDKPEYFDCYRFFGNGRLMSYRFFSKIDSSAFVNINVGGIGYYHVLNNIIRMQQFTVNGQHFKEGRGGMLIHNYGIVKENNIIMDHESIGKEYYAPRSNLENGYKLIFKKTQIDAPLLHPTW